MPPRFERKKISLKSKKKYSAFSLETKRALIGFSAFLLVIGFVYIAGMKLLESLGGTRLFTFFSNTVGKELEIDERNHTNILLFGIGGIGHDGEDLTDTIIIASINHDTTNVSMLSVPRDFYIHSSLGDTRINGLYELGKKKWDSTIGLDFAKETIAKEFEIPIHYVVKVDFKAFKEIIDGLGGVDITVEEAINDPFYPKDGTYEYEPFILEAGIQHLDGDTALKYVRSRKTSSDFDRSRRQQQILVAIKDTAHEQNKLSKASFIKSLYYSLSTHIETSLGIREMLSLASFAQRWDSKNLMISTMTDDPSRKGGFLYTPDRTLFGGAFVLLAASTDQLRTYLHGVIYENPAINKLPIAVLNGTKSNGLAAIAKQALQRYGIEINRFGNARNQKITQTKWFVNEAWTYNATQASLNATGKTSLITFDEKGAVSSILDEHLEALINFVTAIVPGPVEAAPDEYKNDPRFYNSALILELGTDEEAAIHTLELSYELIAPTIQISEPIQEETVGNFSDPLEE